MNAPFKPEAVTDPDEAHEIAREAAFDEFREWQRWDRSREDADFADWLVRMSQPHMVDWEKYDLALTYAERPRLSDKELNAIAADQRRFARQKGNR